MMRISLNLIKAVLGLALSSLCLMSCGKQTDYRDQGGNANTVRPEDRPLHLKQFEQIHGTHYLMAEITEAQSRTSLSSSSYSENGNIRNLVFLDGDSLASHRLSNTNAYVILATTQYPTHESEGDSPPRSDAVVTQWLVYQVLKADTNGDGRLDGSDQQTLAVTDASGSGYAEILSEIDENLGMTMLGAGQIVVVYSHGGAKSAAVIDLGNRKVVSTNALADLGSDVR